MAPAAATKAKSGVVALRAPRVLNRELQKSQSLAPQVDEPTRKKAVRTAFVARFIVLREGRRSRAHRTIEELTWTLETTAEDLAMMLRNAFVKNGDKLDPVDRDIRRALEHARCSVSHFIDQYVDRSTTTFREALDDYERSNVLLFGDEQDIPRKGGWRPHS